VTRRTPDGRTPAEQLEAIAQRLRPMVESAQDCLHDQLLPLLERHGITVKGVEDLTSEQRDAVDRYFDEQIFPVLTPLAVDPGHPFPYISNLSLSLAVTVRDRKTGNEHFARVKVPGVLPRFVAVPAAGSGQRAGQESDAGAPQAWVPLEDVIADRLHRLFPGMDVLESFPFRVTRNTDMDLEEEEAEDLLMAIEEELRRRRFGAVVRLEVSARMSDRVLTLLQEELDVTDTDTYRVPGLLGLGDLDQLADLDLGDLRWPAWQPVDPRLRPPSSGAPRNLFAEIRRGDILVHHPYDSFTHTVERFITMAARTRRSSPSSRRCTAPPGTRRSCSADQGGRAGQAGRRARRAQGAVRRGGQHPVGARAGEGGRARRLRAGRTEDPLEDGARRAARGTRWDPPLRAHRHRQLQPEDRAAVHRPRPVHLRRADRRGPHRPVQLPDRLRAARSLPAAPRRPGRPARAHRSSSSGRSTCSPRAARAHPPEAQRPHRPRLVAELYRASRAGVQVDLVIRGSAVCGPACPGQRPHPGDERRGRLLEHSRIAQFGPEDIWIGSADWMPRNLDRRVEVMVPISDPELAAELRSTLDLIMADNVQAWSLAADGSWARRFPADGEQPIDSQHLLMDRARERAGSKPPAT
jgi:polyphosphate kinase